MVVPASKYHSYGNDFLLVRAHQVESERYPFFSRAICEPHQGVGADGCIFVSAASGGRFALRIFNRDGSEASMSGNGARCACAFLHHRSLASDSQIELETAAGARIYQLLEAGRGVWRYRSQMGAPDFSPSRISFQAPVPLEKVEDYPVQVAGQTVRISALFVGNPQCVVFVDELPERTCFEKVGAGLETHPLLAARTNVSFVKVEDSHRLRILIWERGVGPTRSSGTGSCGAAVAAIQTGRAQSPVVVSTETGEQQVEWVSGGEIILTGAAEFVADVQFHWRSNG